MEQNSIDKHVGGKLKTLRSELNLEIEHFAQILDIGVVKLREYEAGVERVCAAELYRIANALQISAAYFFSGIKRNAADCSNEITEARNIPIAEALELMRAFGGIGDASARRQLIELARSFASDPAAELAD
jgi:transcriptional regulator with XRE-family HTH domain